MCYAEICGKRKGRVISVNVNLCEDNIVLYAKEDAFNEECEQAPCLAIGNKIGTSHSHRLQKGYSWL